MHEHESIVPKSTSLIPTFRPDESSGTNALHVLERLAIAVEQCGEEKLLEKNPWHQFTWIEGRDSEIRQFDEEELLSLIDFFEQELAAIPIAAAFAKFCLWSCGRRFEVSQLKWQNLRVIGKHEIHFEILGKWRVDKWARIPKRLYEELLAVRTTSPFVFGCYPQQLREYHLSRQDSRSAKRVIDEFNPVNLGEWMYRKVKEWEKRFGTESAYLHVFRKTTLQYAHSGEDISRQVAQDARVSEGVMMTHYAKVRDVERRNQSNRTYRRILSSLPLDVARRYGYEDSEEERLLEQLELARRSEDWNSVGELAKRLQALKSGE